MAPRTPSASRWSRSITARLIQQVLGAFWILDGVLQLQPFMFSNGMLTQIIEPSAQGQPDVVGHSIIFMSNLLQPLLVPANAAFAIGQLLIGLGLLVSRRTVKAALVASFVWVPVVWWFGEGLGMLLTGVASPLTGAPGAVLLYGLVGLLVWPKESPHDGLADRRRLTDVGGRTTWLALWVLFGGLMLLPANRHADAFSNAASTAAGLAPWPFAGLDSAIASAAVGRGSGLAGVLSLLMVLIGLGVIVTRLRNPSLVVGSALSLLFWVTTQNFGGLFTGSGTDPNSGPLIALIALALYRKKAVVALARPGLRWPGVRVVAPFDEDSEQSPSPRPEGSELDGRDVSMRISASSGGIELCAE